MRQFEYKMERIRVDFKSVLKTDKNGYNPVIIEKLNTLGKEGWELAGTDGTWFYFKRELI